MIELLGVAGDEGSFSEQAGWQYAKKMKMQVSLVYLTDMEGVLAAVEAGQVETGIFPVVNVRGGLVMMAFAAMGRHAFTPIDECWLEVNQCLLVLPGTKKEHITKIISHAQGLAQCQDYLQHYFPQAEQIAWQDTAKAAKELAQGKFHAQSAVIAPARSAELYGLDILAKDIQDMKPNLTGFVIVKGEA